MIIEPDQHYYVDGKYVWTPEKRDNAWKACFATLEQAAQSGKYKKLTVLIGVPGAGKSTYTKANHKEDEIIFDGVFTKKEERLRAVSIAKNAHVPVEGVWLDTPLEVCLERNARRTDDRKVPEDTIRTMVAALHQDPPTAGEGYDAFRVLT